MKFIIPVLLVIHIVGGTVCLATGVFNLLFPKGSKTHRYVGLVFVYSMLATSISALILSVLRPNYFLFMIGVFSVYMTVTAFRIVRRRKPGINSKPYWPDWLLTIAMMLVGAAFVIRGIINLAEGYSFGTVSLVFGIISLLFTVNDVITYRSTLPIKWWLLHLQRMTGSYIAAATAFLVVNSSNLVPGISPLIYWLLPTIILTPLIIYWSRRFRNAPPYKRSLDR